MNEPDSIGLLPETDRENPIMKTVAAFALTLAAALPAARFPAHAALADWSKARTIGIAMTDHGFVPARITLKSGAPYVLRFTNRSKRGHDFSAKSFLRVARVEPADGYLVRNDKVDLDPGRSAALRLIAPTTPGARYDFKSAHLTDAASGLKGSIDVK